MKERPVIFNGEMVRAILDGSKTQTRRIVSRSADIESISTHLDWVHSGAYGKCRPSDKEYANKAESLKSSGLHAFRDANGRLFGLHCPFGQVGDRLWVRETFAAFDADWKHPGKPHDLKDGPWPNVVYPASVAKIPDGTCRPSIHMPRWASRITLEITAVRVERLNDISEEDAKAEGVKAGVSPGHEHMMHQVAFRELWQSIYGEESWAVNPWVWVIEFKQVSASEVEHG
ncbi:TPA: hypothetical protein ACGD5C_001527 [Serratia marcescens]